MRMFACQVHEGSSSRSSRTATVWPGTLLAGLAFLGGLAIARPAWASTLPGAGDTGVLLGAGIGAGGLGVSIDAPVSKRLRLGGSIGGGAPLFGTLTFDVRGAYLLPNVGVPKLDLAVIAGVMGGALGSAAPVAIGLEAGAGASYQFVPKLVGRLNLVYSIPFYGALSWSEAPALGLEIGYKFTPRLEGTLGETGRGENIGIRYTL